MKNFKEKISEQLYSFSVKKPTEAKCRKEIYADYIELISLFANDYISQSDVVDRLKDSGEEFDVTISTDGEIGLGNAQQNDSAERFVNTIFDYIEEREIVYNEAYPFSIAPGTGLKLKDKESLTDQQKLYLYLLIASSLNSFNKIQTQITSEFEKLSEIVLKSYLPSHAVVVNFANNENYAGTAIKKIKQLAKNLNLRCKEDCIDKISVYNSKEKGLDIVAWIPFEDKNPNTIIILGQCACGRNWFGKQNETLRYENFLEYYRQPFTHMLFIPYDLNNKGGRFGFDVDLTTNHLIFERRRILNLANNSFFEKNKYSKLIIEVCLGYQEGLV